jgi:Fe2+ transport system protein FeoA
MKQQEKTLDELPLNTKGYIKKLNCNGNIRRRLLDLGFVEGACITPVLISPSRDPRAFSIRGTLIAIRKDDANLINIYF